MTLAPQGEELRKAVKWISQERQDNPNRKTVHLIEAACLRFNLSPKDADFLARCLKEDKGKQAEGD